MRITEQTSTELLEPSVELHAAMRRTTLRITDRVGNVRYRMAALPVHGSCRVRWDPRIAVPQGGLSIEDVDREPATAQVDWSENRILILDNSRLLHRRPAVRGSGERILERTYLWDD
ncbi:hypothetical protein ACF1GY_05485 [Streptomyces sp. NPDC014684]|uniref:hypothetical protein n=1 Tax=Streptomyces sp. NPDC014684 TaxID=3364880 RepID=UPI0037020E7E